MNGRTCPPPGHTRPRIDFFSLSQRVGSRAHETLLESGAAAPGSTSAGIEGFVKDLNDNGKLGYHLDKSVSYGGEGPTQSYAAVLRLDAGNKYEYDWLSSPDKKLLEGRLNYQAKKGFNFVDSYALTYCSGGSSEDEANPTSPESLIFRLKKGNAFLLERKNGGAEQTKEFKVFVAKVHLGDSAEKTIQAGLDAAAPQGFRPVKILFARQGLLDFSLSVLAERNLKDDNPPKTEYRFLKKTSGLPKDVNALAAQGFRFITGRRVGMVGVALLTKQTSNSTMYTFVEEKKYAKEFDKTVALGNSYQGLMAGDLTCGSTEVDNERLVFAQNYGGEKHEYKIQNISVTKTGAPADDSLLEFRRLVGEGYQVKDLFHSGGLSLIFEK
jgi:hypothetical protein